MLIFFFILSSYFSFLIFCRFKFSFLTAYHSCFFSYFFFLFFLFPGDTLGKRVGAVHHQQDIFSVLREERGIAGQQAERQYGWPHSDIMRVIAMNTKPSAGRAPGRPSGRTTLGRSWPHAFCQ